MSTAISTKSRDVKCPIPGCLNWNQITRIGICFNCYKICLNIGIFNNFNRNTDAVPLADIIYLYKQQLNAK